MLCEISTDRELKTAWFTHALATDRLDTSFQTWFQPVIDTAAHRITGHECLIRCRDSQLRGADGQLKGGEEIFEAARSLNLVPLFDSFAMELAIHSAAQAAKTGGPDPGLFFINVLPGRIASPEIALRPALEAIAESGIKPQNFVFEAVDSDLVGDSARLRAVHTYVRNAGCGFGLDNAGLGSACFDMIRDLRPDYVKIDRRLIWNAEQPVCAALIRKLVELADRHGAEAIAIGVERPRMVENLWLLGAKTMQGYLFGRPSRQMVRSSAPAGSRTVLDLANLALALESDTHEAPLFTDLN